MTQDEKVALQVLEDMSYESRYYGESGWISVGRVHDYVQQYMDPRFTFSDIKEALKSLSERKEIDERIVHNDVPLYSVGGETYSHSTS